MESKAKIRRLYFVKKYSINQIIRECNISKNTVRKIIRSEHIGDVYERKNQYEPKLGEFRELLDSWLESDHKLPRKQRRNAMRYYSQLSSDYGYKGAYDSVQRYVKIYRQQNKEKLNAFIPLIFAPGEALQFDWSDEIVQLGGIDCRLKIAQFKLCYSRKFIVIAYFRETQEMLFDAHNRAFNFFGGQTLRAIYDNMKTAVDTVFIGKERDFNRKFLLLMDHYLLEPTACSPAAGWEKGRVERQVDYLRNWIFLPKLKFDNINELNKYLEEKCISLSQEKKHPDFRDKTIQEMFAVEVLHLRKLIKPYIGYGEIACKVSSTSLVTFDRNCYSVECSYANKMVIVQSYPEKIEIVCNGQSIGSHIRHYEQNKTTFDAFHYLPLLERKPGALRNGAPFAEWELPVAISKVKAILMKRKGGDKECAEILCSMRVYGIDAVEVACELAVDDQVITRDYILNALNRLRVSASPEAIETPDTLKLNIEPTANCDKYNELLTRISNVIH